MIVQKVTRLAESLTWEETAIYLSKSANYVKRIREITVDYKRGIPLSERAIEAYEQDLSAYEHQQQSITILLSTWAIGRY